MYISPDDAKTDVILAAVVAVLGIGLRGLVAAFPFYPRAGLAAVVAEVAWYVALTGLVPILLARYRGDRAAAFGWKGPGGALRAGLLPAVPAVVLGLGLASLLPRSGALLGRIGTAGDALATVAVATQVLALSGGSLLLVGFLAVRSRDGFPRSPDTSLTQLLRTIGLATVAVAAVGGVLRGLTSGAPLALAVAIANVIALAAILLLTDRLVSGSVVVPRTTVLVPVIVAVVGHIWIAGGFFRGDLIAGLSSGALAAGVALAIASLTQTRHGLAAAVPLALAVHLWPTCLSPLVLVTC